MKLASRREPIAQLSKKPLKARLRHPVPQSHKFRVSLLTSRLNSNTATIISSGSQLGSG